MVQQPTHLQTNVHHYDHGDVACVVGYHQSQRSEGPEAKEEVDIVRRSKVFILKFTPFLRQRRESEQRRRGRPHREDNPNHTFGDSKLFFDEQRAYRVEASVCATNIGETGTGQDSEADCRNSFGTLTWNT